MDTRIILSTGHGFTVIGNTGTPEQPSGQTGVFDGDAEEWVERVPLDSYAYTHGGRAYREAVEVLHGRHVFHIA